MSDEDVKKTVELKRKIEKELDQLLEKLKSGTIDRNELESGLKRLQESARNIPWFKD
jgi:plasmid stabilization system protein ParE